MNFGYVIASKTHAWINYQTVIVDEFLSREVKAIWLSRFDTDLEKAKVYKTAQDAFYEILSYPDWIDEGGAWIVKLQAPTSGWASRVAFSEKRRKSTEEYALEHPPRSKRVARRLAELRKEVGLGAVQEAERITP